MLYVKGATTTPEGAAVIEVAPLQPESLLQITNPLGEYALTASSVFLFKSNFRPSQLLSEEANNELMSEIHGHINERDPSTHTPNVELSPCIQLPDGTLKPIVSFEEIASEAPSGVEALAA